MNAHELRSLECSTADSPFHSDYNINIIVRPSAPCKEWSESMSAFKSKNALENEQRLMAQTCSLLDSCRLLGPIEPHLMLYLIEFPDTIPLRRESLQQIEHLKDGVLFAYRKHNDSHFLMRPPIVIVTTPPYDFQLTNHFKYQTFTFNSNDSSISKTYSA